MRTQRAQRLSASEVNAREASGAPRLAEAGAQRLSASEVNALGLR